VFNSSRVTISTDTRSAWDCFQRWVKVWGPTMGMSTDGVDRRARSNSMGSPGPSGVTHGRRDSTKLSMLKRPVISKSASEGSRKMRRHTYLYEAIRKLAKKRESNSNKPGNRMYLICRLCCLLIYDVIATKQRANLPNDAHNLLGQAKHLTPGELSRMKQERDQQILLDRKRAETMRQAALANRFQVCVPLVDQIRHISCRVYLGWPRCRNS
jgi:chromatin modification-related protein VID21